MDLNTSTSASPAPSSFRLIPALAFPIDAHQIIHRFRSRSVLVQARNRFYIIIMQKRSTMSKRARTCSAGEPNHSARELHIMSANLGCECDPSADNHHWQTFGNVSFGKISGSLYMRTYKYILSVRQKQDSRATAKMTARCVLIWVP